MPIDLTPDEKTNLKKTQTLLDRVANATDPAVSDDDYSELQKTVTIISRVVAQAKQSEKWKRILSQVLRAVSVVLAGIIAASTALIINIISGVRVKDKLNIKDILYAELFIYMTYIIFAVTISALIIVIIRWLISIERSSFTAPNNIKYVNASIIVSSCALGLIVITVVVNGYHTARASICVGAAIKSMKVEKLSAYETKLVFDREQIKRDIPLLLRGMSCDDYLKS